MSARLLIAVALAASTALIVAYLAAGGGSYEPTAVADPCLPRDWREPEGIEESGQQFALSALDGAACELSVTREELAVALATPEARERFARERGIDEAEFEAAVRAGVIRGIEDAERAGELSATVASGLRAVATRLPVDEAIAVIEDSGDFLDGAGGVLDELGGLFDDADGLLP